MGRPHIGSSVIKKGKIVFFFAISKTKIENIWQSFLPSLGYFSSSNLYSIICNFTFHQNLCIWQFVFNKAQWIEFMDGVNIRNFCRKKYKIIKRRLQHVILFPLFFVAKRGETKNIWVFGVLITLGPEPPSPLNWANVYNCMFPDLFYI